MTANETFKIRLTGKFQQNFTGSIADNYPYECMDCDGPFLVWSGLVCGSRPPYTREWYTPGIEKLCHVCQDSAPEFLVVSSGIERGHAKQTRPGTARHMDILPAL